MSCAYRRFIVCTFLALSLAIASSRASAAVMFGATSAGGPGELYTLNPANGAMVSDLGPLHDAGNVNYPITGLAFHPTTGVLYGSTGNAGAVDALLVTINPITALVTVVGSFNTGVTNSGGTPATMADIGFNSAGNLYGVSSIGGPNLYTINTATGQATIVGPNGASTSTTGGGVAISGSGTIFGTPTSARFGTYNSVGGAYTNISNPVKPAGGAYGALEFNPDNGVLYGLNVGSGSPPPTHVVTFDTSTGAITDLGASVQSLDAIAFQVPEPASFAMLTVAATVIAGTKRRRRTALPR